MLRRAAVRGCGATSSSRGQPSALLLAWRRPSSAPAAAAGGGLLQQRRQQQQQQQQQQLHTARGAASAACLHRRMDSDSRAGYCTLRDARSWGGKGGLLPIPGLQQMQQQMQQHDRRRGRPHFEGLRLPTSQWRALLSTAPPSKEDDKAAQASAGTPPAGTPPPEPPTEDESKKKPTWKDMLKKHGPVFLVYWNGMWLLSGLTIYAGLTLGGIDPLPLAYAVNLDRLIDLSRLDPAHGNVAVAIVLNEAAELVRFPLVVATVPRVTRWWERVRPDFMKPKLGPDGKPKPTLADQVRRHGPVFVVWWGTLWAVGAAGLFAAFEYDLFGGVDALSLARSVNLDQLINLDAIPPSWGNLGVAIAFNEALEVVRFPLAVATVPYLTRWWERRRGIK